MNLIQKNHPPHPDISDIDEQVERTPLSIARAAFAMERGNIRKVLQVIKNWGEVILLLSTLPLPALEPIDINTCNPNCVIGKNLEILEDKTNLLTIEDIRGMETEDTGCYDMMHKEAIRRDAINRVSTTTTTDSTNDTTNPCWKKSESDKPNFGFSSSSYWVRFKVKNKKDKSVEYFLELDYSMLDFAHFYFESNDKMNEICIKARLQRQSR